MKKGRLRRDLKVRPQFFRRLQLLTPSCRQIHAGFGCVKKLIISYSCRKIAGLLRTYTYTQYCSDGNTKSVQMPQATAGIRTFVIGQIAGIATSTSAAVDVEHKRLNQGDNRVTDAKVTEIGLAVLNGGEFEMSQFEGRAGCCMAASSCVHGIIIFIFRQISRRVVSVQV
jgi:hypothetical protein